MYASGIADADQRTNKHCANVPISVGDLAVLERPLAMNGIDCEVRLPLALDAS